ncbi:hypothetical protein [Candidatus Aalborgicola defluviihabitans]|uniref:hypothetical protein n=1 Tax=Candidatus Aalborgicola defluviihabitans TaxID=3386187 RepID=UPI00390A8049|nr:hypothetical protein [Burkholderiales bacterium]
MRKLSGIARLAIWLETPRFPKHFLARKRNPSEEDVEQLGGVKHAMTLGSHFGDHVLHQEGMNVGKAQDHHGRHRSGNV